MNDVLRQQLELEGCVTYGSLEHSPNRVRPHFSSFGDATSWLLHRYVLAN